MALEFESLQGLSPPPLAFPADPGILPAEKAARAAATRGKQDMSETVDQAYIFVPMLVVVMLTFAAFVRMGVARGRAVKEGMDPDFYKAHQGTPEPEYAAAATRHFNNMFEMPTLFYAACLTAYALEAVTFWSALFAWGYVLGRLIQSLVHMTYNNPGQRGIGFMLGVVFMFAFWVDLAIAVFERL